MTRNLVLGMLRNGERLHGYALVRAYRELTGSQVNSGNFYRELLRLAAEGLVRPAAIPDADARRIQYEITEAGTSEFDEWFDLLAECPVSKCEDELSLRSLFVAKVEPELGRRLLERWRDELWFRSQGLERERDAALARSRMADGGLPRARASLLGRRLRHVAADLDFLDELRRTYESRLTQTGAVGAASGAAAKAEPRARKAARHR